MLSGLLAVACGLLRREKEVPHPHCLSPDIFDAAFNMDIDKGPDMPKEATGLPQVGDEVEMFSRYAHKWFPAFVEARSPSAPFITTRLKGNSAVDNMVAEDEIRPMRRLDAARRVSHDIGYPAYDADNIKHLRECDGCPECAGVGAYYYECVCGWTTHCTTQGDICPHCKRPSSCSRPLASEPTLVPDPVDRRDGLVPLPPIMVVGRHPRKRKKGGRR